jgi:tRNA A-37 threonylcarbamoyl transferase component Bud32
MKHKNIKDYLASQYPHHTWVLIHERSIRSVYRLDKGSVPQYFVKIYDPKTFLEKIRNLLRPRTLHEAHMLARLNSSGILVPGVHDHIRFHFSSALVTRAVAPAQPLYEIGRTEQAAIMLDLAVKLLCNNFFFSDMHVGNIILDRDGRPFLLDAYEIKPCRKIREAHIISLFAQVHNIYNTLDDELMEALERLGIRYDPSELAQKIRRKSLALRLRYVRRRVKRSMRHGSFTQEQKGEGYRAYVRRDYDLDLDDVLDQHAKNIRQMTHVLKYQEKTQLSCVEDYCVKTYKPARPLCSPYALRSWKGLLTLYLNWVGVAEPVAVGVFENGSSVLVTHMLSHPDLDMFLCEGYLSLKLMEKRDIAAAFGRLIGRLHAFNIYHADLKACNIKIDTDHARFYVLDTDRIEQRRSISRAKRLKNLVQINTSIPLHISRGNRMTFLKAYAAHTGDDPRMLFKDVWEGSAGSEILYCTSDGDRTETWPAFER